MRTLHLIFALLLPLALVGCPGTGRGDDDSGDETPSSTATAVQSALGISISDLSFTHTYGTTDCPQDIGTITLTNATDAEASYTVSDSGSMVGFSSTMGTIAAGESVTIDVAFNGCVCADFTSTVTATVTNGAKENTQQATVTGTFNGCP